jgi:hypothetical protein
VLEEISFPSALKHKTDAAIAIPEVDDISAKSFTLTTTLTSIDFVPPSPWGSPEILKKEPTTRSFEIGATQEVAALTRFPLCQTAA